MTDNNPWIRPREPEQAAGIESTAEAVLEPDRVLGSAEVAQGTPVPLHASARVSSQALTRPPVGTLTVLGLHGGAATSTVAALLGDATDHEQPWRPGDLLPAGFVVVVARIHASGLTQATQFARAWSSGQVGEVGRLLGLVLVDDAPKPNVTQAATARLLAGSVPRTWRLPWVEEWRTTAASDLPTHPGPRRVRATTKSIHGAHRAAAGN